MPDGDITVDIAEWFARGNNEPLIVHEDGTTSVLEPAKDEDLSPEQLAEVLQRREQLRVEMERMQAIQERADRLDKEPRECSECGEVEAHYTDDFVCFRCRDKEESC